MTESAAQQAPAPAGPTSFRRCILAAAATLCLNALLAGGLALWEARKDVSGRTAEQPPLVVTSLEPEPPPPVRQPGGPGRPRQERPAPDQPRPRPLPELEMALPGSDARAPVSVAPGPPVDLSAWNPSLDFAVAAPPAPSGPGAPSEEPGSPAPARPSRGPVLRQPPKLDVFYPRVARDRDIEGRTRVRLRIDRNGRVTEATVLESTPGSIFNSAAVRASKEFRFTPALRDGEPVPAVVEIPIVWELN
jgi:protein TonB